jgi:cysteine-rich repeat protein
VIDAGEQCDDGNLLDGDCCSSACTITNQGTGCDDDNPCTANDTCSSGSCTGTPATNGTSCDDGSQCTVDTCQSGLCISMPTPLPTASCKIPTATLKSQLQLKDKTADKSDQVVWTWTHGQATMLAELGDPTAADDYELCVYGPGPTLLFHGHAPAGGTCNGVPCWTAKLGKGFVYRSKQRDPDGMERISLVAGLDGAASASARGKGVFLNLPSLGGLPLPIRAQLRGAGTCFEAIYSSALYNTTAFFKAKSD